MQGRRRLDRWEGKRIFAGAHDRRERLLAKKLTRQSVEVIENREIAPGHFVMSLGDAEMAGAALPGQFFQVRLKGRGAPFLPRPFSLFDWRRGDAGRITGFRILYKVVGSGTRDLSRLRGGDTVAVTGPLGNSFEMPEGRERIVIVAGGIGVAPFLAFARNCIESGFSAERVALLYGAQRAEFLVAVDEFRELGIEVVTATDDASAGRHTTALGLLEERVADSGAEDLAVFSAGPTAMLNALALFCRQRGIPAQLSLEARMICGFGVCNSCAVRIVSPESEGGWDYKLVCRDGPIFRAGSLHVE